MGKKGGPVMPAEMPAEIIKKDYQPLATPDEAPAAAQITKKKKKGPSTLDFTSGAGAETSSFANLVSKQGLNL